MKNLKNGLNIARAAIFSMLLFVTGSAFAQTEVCTPVPALKDNAAIHYDVSVINKQKAKVSEWHNKLSDDRKAGKDEVTIMDKKEYRKAKAELKKDKSYLVADAKDVASDNKLAINHWKRSVRDDRSDLRHARKALKKAKNSGDEIAIRSETARVDFFEKCLKEDKAALASEKQKRSEDASFLKKELKRLEGTREWYYLASL